MLDNTVIKHSNIYPNMHGMYKQHLIQVIFTDRYFKKGDFSTFLC